MKFTPEQLKAFREYLDAAVKYHVLEATNQDSYFAFCDLSEKMTDFEKAFPEEK